MSRPTPEQETAWCERYEERLRAHKVRIVGRLFPMDSNLQYFLALSPGDKHGTAFSYGDSVFESPESADEYADRAFETLRSDLQHP